MAPCVGLCPSRLPGSTLAHFLTLRHYYLFLERWFWKSLLEAHFVLEDPFPKCARLGEKIKVLKLKLEL